MSDKEEIAAGDRAAQIEAMLEQSKGTDILVLLKAKEAAKKAVKDDPSNANLAALQRASKMLEDAQVGTTEKRETLKTATDVLEHLLKNGRKIKKSKLYQDIRKGILRRNADLTFSVSNVNKYGTTLPMAETPEMVAQEAEERVRRKDNADIRIKEAEARRKELAADVAEGKYIPRDMVEQELAARAVTLNSGLKSAFEASSLDLIDAVGGDPKQAHHFLRKVEAIIDNLSNRYAQPMEIEVNLDDPSLNPEPEAS